MKLGSNTKSKLLTPDELANYLSVSKVTIYRYVDKRTIPFHKVGNNLRFDWQDILEYLKDNRVEPINK